MKLKYLLESEISSRMPIPVATDAEEVAAGIIGDVRKRGWDALHEYALKFGDIKKGEALFIPPEQLERACDEISADELSLLQRTHQRIALFAKAQLASVSQMEMDIPGGKAGQSVVPVERAGCYAPGGRFPLPSSVLMTAATARVAGVRHVMVASPKPVPLTLAAAHVAGADGLISAGGAQMIAAFAFGAGEISPVDVIVGPGNKYVTAAKKQVFGQVSIDMLAGPSELVVLADDTADADTIAADLLAQAEHDVVAVPILVTPSRDLAERVNAAVEVQLAALSTRDTAEAGVANGFIVLVEDVAGGVEVCDRLAPEHLEIVTENAEAVAQQCQHYGAVFVGGNTAEVLGDYGAGPNHTLPTGGTARYTGGLSVFDFLRIRTWMRIDDSEAAASLVSDAEKLARLEGLHGHGESALRRLK